MRFHGTFVACFLTAFVVTSIHAATPGIIGDWSEPTGSVIRIASCGQRLCARIVQVSRHAPASFDVHNPDEAQRSRPLCGLVIGQGFHLSGSEDADGGLLYDPKSGRTYHGSMHLNGDQLELRGYIGLKLFGRTEIWNKVKYSLPACTPS